jgi:hypothetical protein
MTPESIEKFFDEYAAAFSRRDVREISRLWKLPAFITTQARSVCFTDADEFRRNLEDQCAFYVRQGLAQAKKTIVNISGLSNDVALVTTWDELFDASGKHIAQWQHAYLVRETKAGIRAIAAVADRESTAWNAEDPPLRG